MASVAIYFLAGLALVVVLLALVGEDDLVDGPWLLVAVVGPQTMMLVHLVWVSRSKGLGLRADFGLSLNRTDIRLGLSLFAAALFGAGIVGAVTQAITGEQPTASAVELAQDSGSDGLTVWLILFGILGATFIPVVEELVFRGLLWGALEKRGMRPLPILVATSVLFSAIHLEPTRTPILFAVAMALGFGRYRTGRIGAPIVTHVLINSLAMSVTLIDLA